MQTQSLFDLLAPAQKTQGWNLRSELPRVITIHGGCVLHVVPAWLWQPRVRPRICRFDTAATPMRKVRKANR